MLAAAKTAVPVPAAAAMSFIGQTKGVTVAHVAEHESRVLAPWSFEGAVRHDALDSACPLECSL
jgi:hypothetical protein